MRGFFASAVLLHCLSSAVAQQCTQQEFSIQYESNPIFTAARNGSCVCTGNFVGNGASLSDLAQNPAVANHTAWLTRLENQQAAAQASARAGFASTATMVCNTTMIGAIYLNGSTFFGCTASGLVPLVGAGSSTPPPPSGSACTRSCHTIKQCTGTTADGLYSITPSTGDTFQAFCDMNTDGGGWTLIARRAGGSGAGQIPNNNADWNIGTMNPNSDGKLSDSRINAIRGLVAYTRSTYRIIGNVDPLGRRYYLRGTSAAWSSTAMGNNFGGPKLACLSTNMASCTWSSQTLGYLDTYEEVGTSQGDNGCSRMFSFNPCYTYNNNGQGLCVNSGASCTSMTGSAYPPLTYTIWTREDEPTPSTYALTTSLAASCMRSCYAIKHCLPSAPDGFYVITPSVGDSYQVWCDHTTDGGGWTLVARRLGGSGVGQLPASNFDWFQHTLSPSSDGKLSDARINTLRGLSGAVTNAHYRIIGNLQPSGRRLFIRALSTAFNSATMGASFGGSRQECFQPSFSACSSWTSTSLGYIDTYDTSMPGDNSCNRVFIFNPCYTYSSNGQGLCVNSGSTCTSFTGASYPPMTFTIWVREQ